MPNRKWLIGSAVLAAAVFALMWIGYTQRWSWVTAMDSAALEACYRFGAAHPGWVRAWDVYCTVLGPTVLRLVGVVVIVVALVRRHVRTAVFLVLTVELCGLVLVLAKAFADRPRPSTALVDALSSSFPSGHAMGLMVCVPAYLVVLLPMVRPAARGWAIAVGVVVILTIGAGRVVLNVHHPSDVVAGWALGYAYFVGCLLLYPPRVSRVAGTPAALGTAR
ncbi:phosphatase PAP2 family protein [Mycolicibacterium litorale]|uniref:Phosphatase PAP2 family protein n=1 Tax=Mycolicibacterium litorale TaxID=758802 RepID=A0AAD1INS9_9MYCO|nr:phosphatase PAP2 family protein [Mycolicibacterium litorale]MCV7416948.1 phosphatase PAP2 family protein [Mycolicibacterium litorale]TDY04733.1 undecaprenyl-diphosphatase [Mycolicibacterium litorale]BBY18161.1 phosphatase PAP2 family protein [Mycolicibacterium litorale]